MAPPKERRGAGLRRPPLVWRDDARRRTAEVAGTARDTGHESATREAQTREAQTSARQRSTDKTGNMKMRNTRLEENAHCLGIRATRTRRTTSAGLWLAAAALLWLAGSAQASSVVLLGDSWGALGGPSIQNTLANNGYTGTFTNASVGGSTAAQWSSGAITDVGALFGAHPDAVAAHVIIGGNDLIGNILAGGDPVTVIGQTITDSLSLLTQIALATPAPILISGYDYVPSPPGGFSSLEANGLLDLYLDLIDQNVSANALLSSRVTVANTHGLMQVSFGIPQLGLLPGDPSLPDATLPGPDIAFADSIHLTTAGYDVYADELYSIFYSTVVPEPGTAVLVLVGLGMLGAGRRGSNAHSRRS